jgi:phosphatidate cytidylyltransferase
VTRVLSGAVLVAFAVTVVWLATPLVFFLVAEGLLLLGVVEFVRLARARALTVPGIAAAGAALMTAAAFSSLPFGLTTVPLEVVLMSAIVALGVLVLGEWRGGDALGSAAASLFPSLYLGLPIGAMIAIRELRGPQALFLLMLTVAVSDTAQYYTGRTFGRHLLAPAVSPKKTVEGAVGGFVFGTAVLVAVGSWWLPQTPPAMRAGLGLMIVALGIAGDLFESMLKRSAGVKDSSTLIPGHGGVLDRIDALLFAAPIYYVILRYA